ncbi:hypothetical protein EI94DRAFT_1706322 [Lactarius quietus]|nr:hypothetical protein EI94DRAFT_1706322 [Lactarius quietus]
MQGSVLSAVEFIKFVDAYRRLSSASASEKKSQYGRYWTLSSVFDFPRTLINAKPRNTNLFGLKLFVTVANQATKKKTSSVAAEGSTVQWNENLDALRLLQSYVLHSAGLHKHHSIHCYRLRSSLSTDGSLPDILMPAGMSSAEDALQIADEAMTALNLSDTWEGALERIKWVMDTVSPVAELSPYAKMAHGLLFAIPKTLLEQFQRDGNIQILLVAMRDAFDFTNQEDAFKAIERFLGRHKSLRSCCSMSVIAVTLSDHTRRIRNSVRDLYPLR